MRGGRVLSLLPVHELCVYYFFQRITGESTWCVAGARLVILYHYCIPLGNTLVYTKSFMWLACSLSALSIENYFQGLMFISRLVV